MLWSVLWGDFGAHKLNFFGVMLKGHSRSPPDVTQLELEQAVGPGSVHAVGMLDPQHQLSLSTSLSVLMLQQSLPVVPPRGLEITNNYFFWNVCKMTLYFRNFHFFKI